MISVTPTLHGFSRGYYLVEDLRVEPNEDRYNPYINDHVYGWIQDNLYEVRPVPILLKLVDADYHIQLHPSDSVRMDTIELPFEIAQDIDTENPFPATVQFLLAKPRQAHLLTKHSDPDTTVIEG